MSKKQQQSLNSVLQEVAGSNKCISKIGTNISQFFVQLKVKEVGDTSVINKHRYTKERHAEGNGNLVKENTLHEEGRLKVIKSDLKRAQQNRNSVKDLGIMESHLIDHGKRIASQYGPSNPDQPRREAPKIKMARVVPTSSVDSTFKSPSRMQLQDYEAREDLSKPHAVTYRPRFGAVLKSDGQPTAYLPDTENAGKVRKKEIFEQKQLALCQRLMHKIDRGHDIHDKKLRNNESYLDDHPHGFRRKGSMEDHYHLSSSVTNIYPSQTPSLKGISMQNLGRGKRTLSTLQGAVTTLPTGREKSEELLRLEEKTQQNFNFVRDQKRDVAFKTGDGNINVKVSSVTSIHYDPNYDHSLGPDEMLKIDKLNSDADFLRNTQPKGILPAVIGAGTTEGSITDFANPSDNQERRFDSNYYEKTPKVFSKHQLKGNRANAKSQLKPVKASSKQLVMMSKVDSQLSIQQEVNELQVKNSVSNLRSMTQDNYSRKAQTKMPSTAASPSIQTAQMLQKDSSSIIDLHKNQGKKLKLGYEVAYGTKNYHLVRNKDLFGGQDSIELVPNKATTSDTRLPRVKMNLQTNRPPNLVQLHDARFENFNKDPKILSTVKKVSQIDFNKFNKKERHECLINQGSGIGMQKYQINESVVKKRPEAGSLSMSKNISWSQIKDQTKKETGPPLENYDSLKAHKQLLKKTSQYQTTNAGINGPVGYDRQGSRKFTHFQVAEMSEKQERAIELANDEDHMKEQRKIKQKAIMNIHSRIGAQQHTNRQSLSPSKKRYEL